MAQANLCHSSLYNSILLYEWKHFKLNLFIFHIIIVTMLGIMPGIVMSIIGWHDLLPVVRLNKDKMSVLLHIRIKLISSAAYSFYLHFSLKSYYNNLSLVRSLYDLTIHYITFLQEKSYGLRAQFLFKIYFTFIEHKIVIIS